MRVVGMALAGAIVAWRVLRRPSALSAPSASPPAAPSPLPPAVTPLVVPEELRPLAMTALGQGTAAGLADTVAPLVLRRDVSVRDAFDRMIDASRACALVGDEGLPLGMVDVTDAAVATTLVGVLAQSCDASAADIFRGAAALVAA